jgi:hypothetical protein
MFHYSLKILSGRQPRNSPGQDLKEYCHRENFVTHTNVSLFNEYKQRNDTKFRRLNRVQWLQKVG